MFIMKCQIRDPQSSPPSFGLHCKEEKIVDQVTERKKIAACAVENSYTKRCDVTNL